MQSEADIRRGPRLPLKPGWMYALLAILLLRLGVLAVSQAFPEGGVIVDSRAYLAIASQMDRSGWESLGSGDLHWTPGYPVFLLGAQRLTGTTLVGVGLLQLILTGAAAVGLWLVGVSLADARAGVAAAWIYALSPNAALWALTIMSESLFAVLLVMALAAWVSGLVHEKSLGWLVAGMSLGAAALVRPLGLPLIAIWAILTLVTVPRPATTGSRILRTALLLVGSSALIVPWLLRTWTVTGRPVFAEVAEDTIIQFNLAPVMAEAEGISKDEAAARLNASIDSWDDSFVIIAKYPAVFFRHQLRGIQRSVMGVESGVWARQLGYGLDRQGSLEILSTLLAGGPARALDKMGSLLANPETAVLTILAAIALAYTAGLYVLGLAGVASFPGKRELPRACLVLVTLTIAYLMVAPGAAGQGRFRIPAEPYLALLAGAGVSYWMDVIQKRTGRPAA